MSKKSISFIPNEIVKAKFSSQKLKEAQEAFKMYDKDGDNMITTVELTPALRALGYNSNQVIVERITEMNRESSDGVGKVSFEDFLDVVVMYLRYTFTMNDMLEDFKLIDVDNDGKITKTELKSYLESLQVHLSHEEIEEIVNAADLDNDGSIDYMEFVIMMSPKDESQQ